jgi:hypothetical protein
VVVSVRDLAQQLRKRPDVVATALNLLLNAQKVQRARLKGVSQSFRSQSDTNRTPKRDAAAIAASI